MESLYEFGLVATEWLQTHYPSLAPFMVGISQLGRFEFYILLLTLVYWCIHKRIGAHFAYLVIVNLFVNSFFKGALREPRTFWLDPEGARIDALSDEASFGFPSGHAQTTTVTLYFLAAQFRRAWIWVGATVLLLLMGLSRVYLGVHAVHDVVAGVIVGLTILVGYAVTMRLFANRFRHRLLGQKLLVFLVAPLVAAALYVIVMLLLGAPDLSVMWAAFVEPAIEAAHEDAVTAVALMISVGIGFTLEVNRIGFLVDGALWRRAVRYLVGVSITLGLWYGSRLLIAEVTPEGALWLELVLRFAQYTIIGFWVSYWAPLLFTWLRLAPSSSGPQDPFTVQGASVKEIRERKRR